MYISFVVPTFNRLNLLKETINSIILAVKSVEYHDYEVIIVDDASTDSTLEEMHRCYDKEIQLGLFRIIGNKINQGVTSAKNTGAYMAQGCWLVFIDSDDLMIKDTLPAMLKELRRSEEYDAMFFSCINFSGERVGDSFESHESTLKSYLEKGLYGEKLPVIKKKCFNEFPYEARLRGFEGLAYLRMLIGGKRLFVSNLCVRKYRTQNLDRLSSNFSKFKRADRMMLGYKLFILELKNAGMPVLLKYRLQYFFYKMLSYFA